MAIHTVEEVAHYVPLTEEQLIICKAFIGNGQSGAYTIIFDGAVVGANRPATLGKKADILGKTTYVTAHVTDVLQETNWVSLNISFWEGTRETSLGPYNYKVEQQSDEVDFVIQIQHT